MRPLHDVTQQLESSVDLKAPCAAAFEHLDDFTKFGEHMMRSSWMMAGSAMRYEFDDARGRARGATVRMLGSFLGLCLQIDEPGVSPSSAPRHLAPHPKWITSERAPVS